ncbi:MAG TPA: SOS response-associated peptidase [Burkholderiales bacterium]|nr:SOS response-associated peptidase [Burkholderiales bacterium]
MCGRFVSPEERALERAFDLGRRDNPNPFARRYNVFPTDTVPFLRLPASATRPELAVGRWGMVPHWWKEAKPPKTSFNARLEDAAGKPMWRDAFARSRCLIPAEGWYEWRAVERIDPATGEIKAAKQPYFIRRNDAALFCFAGLAAYWKDPETGAALRSCAILTAAATGALAEIHGRAPVVLPADACEAWLDRRLIDPQEVKAVAERRLPPSELTRWKVRLLVNNAKADGPELIERLDEEEADPASAASGFSPKAGL